MLLWSFNRLYFSYLPTFEWALLSLSNLLNHSSSCFSILDFLLPPIASGSQLHWLVRSSYLWQRMMMMKQTLHFIAISSEMSTAYHFGTEKLSCRAARILWVWETFSWEVLWLIFFCFKDWKGQISLDQMSSLVRTKLWNGNNTCASWKWTFLYQFLQRYCRCIQIFYWSFQWK